MFNSDNPILNISDDALGRDSFAMKMAGAVCSYRNPESLVVGLYGEWGSGKSSIANMMIKTLEERDYEDGSQRPLIVNFNPWNFSDQNQLLFQLFSTMADSLGYESIPKTLGKLSKVVDRFSRIIKIVEYAPHPGISAVAKVVAPLLKSYANALAPNSTTIDLQKAKKEISAQLSKIKCKILIFIDDIDRLNKVEIRQIFQAVKSLGDFPNTVYVLMFDKEIVVESLVDVQSRSGEDYLKKIVQIPIPMPEPNSRKVIEILEMKVKGVLVESLNTLDDIYWQKVLDTCIKPYVKNLRDVNRIINSFAFQYHTIGNEVNAADLIALITFEIFIPKIPSWIKANREFILGESFSRGFSHEKDKYNRNYYIEQLKPVCGDEFADVVLDALATLFPVINRDINRTHYHSDNGNLLMRDKRIASPNKFKYYFSYSLDDGEISSSVIGNILNNEPIDVVVRAFSCQDGLGKVFADELRVRADIVPQERVSILLDAVLQAYPHLCTIVYDGVFQRSGDVYAYWIAHSLLLRLDEAERLKFFGYNLSSYHPMAVFLYIDLLRRDERHYGRWGLRDSHYTYVPIFSEEQIPNVENKLLELILQVVSAEFLLSLIAWRFDQVIFVWEKLDNNNPQIVSCMEGYISTNKMMFRLIRQKVTLHHPRGTYSPGEEWWVIDVDGLQRYIDIDTAYQRITDVNSTLTLSGIGELWHDSLVAFMLYCEDKDRYSDHTIKDYLVQEKLQQMKDSKF